MSPRIKTTNSNNFSMVYSTYDYYFRFSNITDRADATIKLRTGRWPSNEDIKVTKQTWFGGRMRFNVKIWKNQDPKMTKLTYQFAVCLLWKKRPCVYISKKYTVIRCTWMACTRIVRTSRNHVRTYHNRWLIANLGQYSD